MRLGRIEFDKASAWVRDGQLREVPIEIPSTSIEISGTCGIKTATPPPHFHPNTERHAYRDSQPHRERNATGPRSHRKDLYIPITYRDACHEVDQLVDIVLLIDASSSMNAGTGAGRSRLAAVQEGARAFLSARRPQDQTALVAFSDRVTLEAGLSQDSAALSNAIDSIQLSSGTRIDVALYAAALELAGPRRRAGSRGVIVLMTDGIPAADTRAAVLASAQAARDAGSQIFAIGVGNEVDLGLMNEISAAPETGLSLSGW